MTLARCLQLMTVQAGLAAGALPIGGRRIVVHPVGRDEDGDPVVVCTWLVPPCGLGTWTVGFREVDPW